MPILEPTIAAPGRLLTFEPLGGSLTNKSDRVALDVEGTVVAPKGVFPVVLGKKSLFVKPLGDEAPVRLVIANAPLSAADDTRRTLGVETRIEFIVVWHPSGPRSQVVEWYALDGSAGVLEATVPAFASRVDVWSLLVGAGAPEDVYAAKVIGENEGGVQGEVLMLYRGKVADAVASRATSDPVGSPSEWGPVPPSRYGSPGVGLLPGADGRLGRVLSDLGFVKVATVTVSGSSGTTAALGAAGVLADQATAFLVPTAGSGQLYFQGSADGSFWRMADWDLLDATGTNNPQVGTGGNVVSTSQAAMVDAARWSSLRAVVASGSANVTLDVWASRAPFAASATLPTNTNKGLNAARALGSVPFRVFEVGSGTRVEADAWGRYLGTQSDLGSLTLTTANTLYSLLPNNSGKLSTSTPAVLCFLEVAISSLTGTAKLSLVDSVTSNVIGWFVASGAGVRTVPFMEHRRRAILSANAVLQIKCDVAGVVIDRGGLDAALTA